MRDTTAASTDSARLTTAPVLIAPVVAVAGLPGAGKTTLLRAPAFAGRITADDMNIDWGGWVRELRAALVQGRKVACADCVFCRTGERLRLEKELAPYPVYWIFLANVPLACAHNVLYRAWFLAERFDWGRELALVWQLAKQYRPEGPVLPVVWACGGDWRRNILLRRNGP